MRKKRITREKLILRELRKSAHSLRELSKLTGYPEASVSCGIRNLRKPDYGYKVTKKYLGNRIYGYALKGKNESATTNSSRAR